MELGKRISEIRKDHNLTQEDLASRYNVTRQTISNWENGKTYPDLDTLVRISDDFGISLDNMLKDDRETVREISKEQKHGRNYTKKILAAFVLGIIIILIGMSIIDRIYVTLDPGDYTVSVKKVTLDNIEIDEVNKVAVYKDLEGGDYLMEDESLEEGGFYEAPDIGVYVFKGEQYASLMHYGCVYEVVAESDKSIDGLYVYGNEDGTLNITVSHKADRFTKGRKRSMVMYFSDFSAIYDKKTEDQVWSKD